MGPADVEVVEVMLVEPSGCGHQALPSWHGLACLVLYACTLLLNWA